MREILFRGKPTDNDEFVYGYLMLSLCRRGGYYHMIMVPSQDLEKEDLRYIVDARTIGQFTGLKDKQGEKIFEGDILLLKSIIDDKQFKIPVVFEDGTFCAKGSGLLCHNPDIKIIGNIHE